MKRIAENALRAVETGVPDRLRSDDPSEVHRRENLMTVVRLLCQTYA